MPTGRRHRSPKPAGSGATVTPRTTSYGYDADGNQTTVKDARGYTTTTAYNANDQATLVTNPDGDATLTCYDSDGHTVQTVPPAGVAADSLTAASCPTSYPSGYTDRLAADATVSTFNAQGLQIAQTSPPPPGQTGYETTTYTYDADGNLLQTSAPPTSNGGSDQTTVDSYNPAGELASRTTGYGTSAASTTSYCYNPDGDTTAVIAPDGNTAGVAACETSSPWEVSSSSYPTQAAFQTTSSYDSDDELVSTTAPATAAAPSGATTTYAYDPEGNTLTSTDPDDVTTTWTYTPDDHMLSATYSGTAAHSVTYSYDAEDDLTSMADATGTSNYVYDPFGEITSATNGSDQNISYNADGQVSGITYPLPATATWASTDSVAYGYDNAGQLDSVTDFNGHQIAITPSADGLPSTTTLGSTGDTVTTNYGNTDTPSVISLKSSSSTLQSFTYAEAPAGNILTETDTPSSSHSPATYTYDSQSRVTSMTPGSGTTLNYGSDASGNLTTLPTGAAGTYNDGSELTSSTLSGTTTTYAYNADGERLTAKQGSSTTASATWNGAGELSAYNDSTANMSAATYQGDGLRASASSTPAGGSSSTQNFVWGDGTKLLQDSSNAYIYTDSAAPAEQVNLSTGAISYLVTDAIGSVRGIVSSSGTLSATAGYDAWGNPETAGGLTSYTPFGFAGGYTDPDGLIYLINRYYDPGTGQFLSVDPDVSETADPYTYTAGDPVNETDPSGEIPKGLGYVFTIGMSFTWQEGEAFVVSWLCGICQQHAYFPLGATSRFVDVLQITPYQWINEVKTGYQPFRSRLGIQADKDSFIAYQSSWPVRGATWWFLPSKITKLSGTNFYERLSNLGINIMLFIYRKGQNDKAYDNANASTQLAKAADTHSAVRSVYNRFPVYPDCPVGDFWVGV